MSAKTDSNGHTIQERAPRPDGTERKPIRIRAGYVNTDEMQRYKAPAKERAERREKEGPIGWVAPEPKPLTKTQIKNRKRKEAKKRKQAAQSADVAGATKALEKAHISDDPEQELKKKIRNLKKKLRQVEALETKAAEGIELEEEQKQKVAKKAEIEEELNKATTKMKELQSK